MGDKSANDLSKFRKFVFAVENGKKTANVNFVMICDAAFRQAFPKFMAHYRSLTESTKFEENDLILLLQFSGQLAAWCQEAIILGRFGLAIRNLVIELDIRQYLVAFFPNFAIITLPFVNICKLLCALECWRDSLYYCEYGLSQDGSVVDLQVLRQICIEHLLPEKPGVAISGDDVCKLPHVRDADWLSRISHSDDLLFLPSTLIYEKRTSALISIEKRIFEERINISLKDFSRCYLDNVKLIVGKIPSEASLSKSGLSHVSVEKIPTASSRDVINENLMKPKPADKIFSTENNVDLVNNVKKNDNPSVKPKVPPSSNQKKLGKKKTRRVGRKKERREPSRSDSRDNAELHSDSSEINESESESNLIDVSQSATNAPTGSVPKIPKQTGVTVEIGCCKLKEMFHFELACKSCIENEVRLESSFIVTTRKSHDKCKSDRILARHLHKKGDFLVKIRLPRQPIGDGKEFSICSSLKRNKNCELKDDCPNAHSPEEQLIWNIVGGWAIAFKEVFESVAASLKVPHSNVTLPKKETVKIQRANATTANESHSSPQLSPTGFVPKLVSSKIVHSLSEAMDILSVIPLFKTHDFYPCCLFCLQNNVFNQHKCDRNVVLCRQRDVGWSTWSKVRPRPTGLWTKVTYFTYCRDHPSCPRSHACTFAHNEMEQILWTREIREHRQFIPDKRGIALLTKALIVDTDFKVEFHSIGVVGFRLACVTCAVMLIPRFYVLYFCKHNCEENMVMALAKDGLSNGRFWYYISKKPVACNNGNFQLCVNCNVGCTDTSCSYAHSELEWRFWRLDFEKKFVLWDYLEKQKATLRQNPICLSVSPTIGSSNGFMCPTVIGQRSTLIQQTSQVHNPLSVASAEKLPLKINVYELLNATSAADTKKSEFAAKKLFENPTFVKKIDAEEFIVGKEPLVASCRFRVYYICGRCHTVGAKVIYQGLNGSSYCNSVQKHIWKAHKKLIIYDDNGLIMPLRHVPDFLRQSYAKHPVNVQMCYLNRCDRPTCSFAHSEIERKCWMYLLRMGKDVDAIVREIPDSRNEAAVSATTVPTNGSKSCPWSSVVQAQTDEKDFKGVSMLALESRSNAFYCYLCDKKFRSEDSFENHCSLEPHPTRLIVDQTRTWACRAPKSSTPFKICEKLNDVNSCPFGNSCTDAHSKDELDEWLERMKFIRCEIERKANNELDLILDMIKKAKAKTDIVVESVQYADVDFFNCSQVVKFPKEKKGEPYRWTFSIASDVNKPLRRVVLLDKRYLYYFRIMSPSDCNNVVCSGECFQDADVDTCYEVRLEYVGSKSLGTFTQEILFDFGTVPYVSRIVTVHVGVNEITLTRLARLECDLASKDSWNVDNCEVMWISKERFHQKASAKDVVTNLHFALNDSTYFSVMEKWILAEEMCRQKILSSFRLSCKANILSQLYNERGQVFLPYFTGSLFARVILDSPLSEDFDIAELLHGYCQYAFVALPEQSVAKLPNAKRRIYEADLVGKHKFGFEGVDQQSVHLCLSATFVTHFKIQPNTSIPLDIQFNIDHKQFARWLASLKMLSTSGATHCIFPDLLNTFSNFLLGKGDEDALRFAVKIQKIEEEWTHSDKNDEQRRVLQHVITCALNTSHCIPPFVIFGPFGTGKTRTLAEAVGILLKDFPKTKILICTQSNSTADLYLKLLETYTKWDSNRLKHMIYRIFAPRMRPDGLPPFVRPYLRLVNAGPNENDGLQLERFTVETLKNVRVVICTLTTAYRLVKCVEDNSSVCQSFTHIFLDEAAQALEVETLMPLCIASKRTCVVLAGDHHQTKPQIYLKEAAEELGRSYLERLYYHYDEKETSLQASAKSRCFIPKILFNKNYRCHPDILSFVSNEFYGSQTSLIPCCNVPESKLKPMYFASAIGAEIASEDGISLRNDTEVAEIFEQLEYFWNNWPENWGEIDIGVITPYFDQMKVINDRVKSERRFVGKVHTSKVTGVQGKEFKVIILSTVRGRNLLEKENLHLRRLGFLHDGRLINTALTRSRYCVVVVGDPVMLCTVGTCKTIWQHYMQCCFDKQSFLPETFTSDALEVEKQRLSSLYGLASSTHSELFDEKIHTRLDADLIIRQLIEKTKSELLPEESAAFSETQSDVDDVVWPEDNNEQMITEDYFVETSRRQRRNTAVSESEFGAIVDVKQLTDEQPNEYKVCILHIMSSAQIYAAPVDRSENVINIRGRKHCKRAFHEDKVLVHITDCVKCPDGNKVYGKVVQIVEQRFNPEGKHFVCCADPHTIGVLNPLDGKLPRIFSLAKREEKGRVLIRWKLNSRGPVFVEKYVVNWSNYDRMLFVVRFLKWSEGYYCPLGFIEDRLLPEKTLEFGLNILDINYGITRDDDARVYDECVQLKNRFKPGKSGSVERLPAEYRSRNRVDLTNLLCFTIDPPDSVDLDDALSIEEGPSKNTYKVGVHIADVASFVTKNSRNDQEAYARGETIYSRDTKRTVHMFNRILSTDLLSLLPDRERAVVSVFFVITDDGIIDEKETAVQQSVIVSRHRLTYQQAESLMANASSVGQSDANRCLVDRLKNLYRLALKLKEHRVGLSNSLAIEHDHMQYFKAETLISEWMVTANKTAAEIVHRAYPELCPLRRQLSPPAQLLQQWREKFMHSALNSLTFRHFFDEHDDENNEFAYFPDVKVLNTTLDAVFRARNNNDIESVCKFVCTESVHPSIVPLTVEMQKMQERSFYQPSGKSSDGDTRHYGMNLNLYTHFTSPIRRYIDIVVHRMLLAAVRDGSSRRFDDAPYDLGELDDICKHCTEKSLRAADRDRDEYSYKLAVDLYKKPSCRTAVISRINDTDVSLEISALEKTVRHLKTLRYNLFNLQKNPEFCVNVENGSVSNVMLSWKKEIYNYGTVTTNRNIVRNKFAQIELSSDSSVTCIRGARWFELLEALKTNDLQRVNFVVDDIRRNRKTPPATDVCSEMIVKASSILQKRSVGFFTNWTTSTTLQIQLGVETRRGLLTPCVQLIKLTPTLNLCLEHQRDTSLCFNNCKRQHTQETYKTVLNYQQLWLPILQIESAEAAIKSGEAIRINKVETFWSKKNETDITVVLELSDNFCKRRDLIFSQIGDCSPHLKNLLHLDYFCIEVPVECSANHDDNYVWIAHCASVDVSIKELNKCKYWNVTCALIHSSTEIPVSIIGKTTVSTVEFLRTSAPHHRMKTALLNLDDIRGTSAFITRVVLGKWNCRFDKPVDNRKSPNDLNAMLTNLKSDLKQPNKDQTNAIMHALTHSFSLIWGPPGTGKTVTAVRLACVIAQLNKSQDSIYKYGNKQPKLLYCAPSNKAVNVVAKIFVEKVHQAGLLVIRMYSRDIERSVFPIPLKESRRRTDQNVDPVIDCIAMHSLIRRKSNSFSERILEMDKKLKEINEKLAKGEEVYNEIQQLDSNNDEDDIISKLTSKYSALVQQAECEEIKERCDVILSTCSAAVEKRLHLLDKGYVIPQVIVDEASMCNEPESLVPIISTACERVTLVGDHKQLGPVVLSALAREFGFDSSLFEKYARRKDDLTKMLTTHYRMNVEIARFPSSQFYENKLKAATIVQEQMDASMKDYWPNATTPLAFCQREGVEQHCVVTTDDSAEMSASNEIEAKHVVRMVQTLIARCGVQPEKIAILSQYRAQIQLISSLLPEKIRSRINVLTVIRSQGDEWDYVFFATVRTCSEAEIETNPSVYWIRKHLGSVTDERQVTVAITRAKKGFIILGNKSLLMVDQTWHALLANYEQRHLITPAHLFLV